MSAALSGSLEYNNHLQTSKSYCFYYLQLYKTVIYGDSLAFYSFIYLLFIEYWLYAWNCATSWRYSYEHMLHSGENDR